MAGCATDAEMRLTQADFDAANKQCRAQLDQDTRLHHPRWFTRWLECKREYVMPMEIQVYRGKGRDIRAMYDKLLRIGTAVDVGLSKVEPVYDEWDRMQAEIGIYKGICYHHPDGTQRCIIPKCTTVRIC